MPATADTMWARTTTSVSRNCGLVVCAVGAVLGLSVACGSDDSAADGSHASGGAGGAPDGGALPDGALPDGTGTESGPDALADGSVVDECSPAGDTRCVGFATVRSCTETASGTRWIETVCESGSGCVAGACVSGQCSDECTLGAVDGAKTCEIWDVTQGSYSALDATGSLHDRARDFLQWLKHKNLAHGGVGITVYSDPPTYNQRVHTESVGDSALWTGTYLAAESLRLMATGAAGARANVAEIVKTLHLWFNVSPSPGVLARYVRPAGLTDPVIDCTNNTRHCNVEYQGSLYDYIGHVSRDQYQGVLLGYALAYEALGAEDEPTRSLIRDDVLELVEELMKERQVNLKITYNGTTYPPVPVQSRFMLIVDEELDENAITVEYSSSSGQGGWRGFQEFVPDLADVFKQVPLLGLIVPNEIPRHGSAIMLSSFFRVALKVSEGVPALATRRAAIEEFYWNNLGSGGNVHDWLAIAKNWDPIGEACGGHYYANNIDMMPLYNWARLETEASIRPTVLGIVSQRTWPGFLGHKNVFFSYLSGANMTNPDSGHLADSSAQLAQFPSPPHARVPVDLRNDPSYEPHEPGCTDQANHATAVDVGMRPRDTFIWQNQPWQLYDEGNLGMTYGGVDYLVAYWLGRRHGFLQEDAGGRCLRWH